MISELMHKGFGKVPGFDELENETNCFVNTLLKSEFPFLQKPLHKETVGYTVDQYAHAFSVISDQVIIEAIQNEGLTFISGKLEFSLCECQSEMTIKMKAFFKGNNGGWIIKSATTEADVSVLNDEGISELIEEEKIEFYLTVPNLKN